MNWEDDNILLKEFLDDLFVGLSLIDPESLFGFGKWCHWLDAKSLVMNEFNNSSVVNKALNVIIVVACNSNLYPFWSVCCLVIYILISFIKISASIDWPNN